MIRNVTGLPFVSGNMGMKGNRTKKFKSIRDAHCIILVTDNSLIRYHISPLVLKQSKETQLIGSDPLDILTFHRIRCLTYGLICDLLSI